MKVLLVLALLHAIVTVSGASDEVSRLGQGEQEGEVVGMLAPTGVITQNDSTRVLGQERDLTQESEVNHQFGGSGGMNVIMYVAIGIFVLIFLCCCCCVIFRLSRPGGLTPNPRLGRRGGGGGLLMAAHMMQRDPDFFEHQFMNGEPLYSVDRQVPATGGIASPVHPQSQQSSDPVPHHSGHSLGYPVQPAPLSGTPAPQPPPRDWPNLHEYPTGRNNIFD